MMRKSELGFTLTCMACGEKVVIVDEEIYTNEKLGIMINWNYEEATIACGCGNDIEI